MTRPSKKLGLQVNTEIEDVSTANTDTFAHCQHIRRAVFCHEQNVPESIEWDGLDGDCQHVLLRVDGLAAATARTRPYGVNLFKIERVAVLKSHRGLGLGRVLMRHIMAQARASGASHAVLNAQLAVQGFYAGLGFVAEGPTFVEADIPHVHMRLKLT
jgi:predicted GNAT family N-acyltransferase